MTNKENNVENNNDKLENTDSQNRYNQTYPSFLDMLKNNDVKFEPMPEPIGTPEERLKESLPKIEKFIQDFAKNTGAGEFVAQNTENMTIEQRLKSIDEQANMAITHIIQNPIDRISSIRNKSYNKTSSDKNKLN